jgi:DNA invertase Pin-like site-specific DNA recombinase
MGMKVGYARASTSEQSLDIQLDRLADCDQTSQIINSLAAKR